MKLSDFPSHVQERIKRENPGLFGTGVRPVPPSQPQPDGRGHAAPAHPPQTGRPCRVVVSLIGLRKRTLDDDNFVGACKHLRDAIAASLGLDDGDKRLTWQYQQLQTKGREGVLVQIEVL